MPFPLVSVVMASRSGVTRLPILMGASAEQEIHEPWEIVVVLDGDIDDSRRVVEMYADAFPLRIVPRDFSNGVIALTRDLFPENRYAKAYGRPANARLCAGARARPAAQRWMHWAACNSVPKAAYEAADGYDLAMTHREDSELGLRLTRSGVELVIDPALEILHRCPATDVEARAAPAFVSGGSTRPFHRRHPEITAGTLQPATAWARLVSAGARRLTSRQAAARRGRRLDRLMPFLPPALRSKSTAWAVEAAAEAGQRQGASDWVRSET